MANTEVTKHPDFPADWKWAVSRPLPPGAVIDQAGLRAKVVLDSGEAQLWVECGGFKQQIFWSQEGVECTVVSTPPGLLFYTEFAAYLDDFIPVAERGPWLKSLSARGVTMLRVDEERCLFEGGYCAVSHRPLADGTCRIYIRDGDDGAVLKDVPAADVQAVMLELQQACPVDFPMLRTVFGFRND